MHSYRRLSGLTPAIPLHHSASTFSDSSVLGYIAQLAFLIFELSRGLSVCDIVGEVLTYTNPRLVAEKGANVHPSEAGE